ncbi:Hypothetical protein PHPALM_38048 [Phytophthora palmivora]|uniref:Chromo domain-containing protein n=1 Tax=Phytophthora palmivora TaxID=4796 RepID=A0A2P4WVX3_9STRA|nr:Hypothetical protein PHPALM_38048 [Phytophthora palmivora]
MTLMPLCYLKINDEYEVEKILDTRWGKRTRTSKRLREYLVKWKGYDETEWLPLSKLNCGALLYEFNQSWILVGVNVPERLNVSGYDETEWLPLSKLNCGALLYEFNQSARARARLRRGESMVEWKILEDERLNDSTEAGVYVTNADN